MWLYRFLMTIFATLTLIRAARSGGLSEIRARLALPAPDMADRPHIWLHAASNGELASVRPVVAALAEARPDLGWLITCNTATGLDLARGWELTRTQVALAPLDLSRISRRIMRDWSVCAHIAVEAEIWPHRIIATPGPVVLLGARMSAGTARGWRKTGRLAGNVLRRVALCIPQDADSAGRLQDLGLSNAACGPVVDLKALYAPSGSQPGAELREAFERSRTWLAASSHDGDEAGILDAHLLAREQEPGLRLILAPRHPRRSAQIAALIHARGLSFACRSSGDDPANAEVLLADTMGEMPLWYALAGRVFIGGTWTDRGGHTPFEPAYFGCALLHGSDTHNFSAAFARLTGTGATAPADTAEDLAKALIALKDPATQSAKGAAAQDALKQNIDLAALTKRIAALIPNR